MHKLYALAIQDAKRRCPEINGYKYDNIDDYAKGKLLQYIQMIHPEYDDIEEALNSCPDLFNDKTLLAAVAMYALMER